MLGHQFTHSSAPVKRPRTITFGILSPEEIKGLSVCKVEYPETYEEGNQRPKPGGLSDPRMGTIDRNFKCATCGEDMAECPGHFGHIELSRAVFHVGFLPKVKKILESICVLCGKLKGSPHLDPRLADAVRFIRDPKKRLAVVHSLVKTKSTCEMDVAEEENAPPLAEGELPPQGHGGCGHVQPQIRREGLKLFMVYSKGKDEDGNAMQPERKPMTASIAHTLLRKIPYEDMKILGLSPSEAHPSWMILTVLPVPPPPVRPSISVDGGAMRGEDDLTYKLAEVIRANMSLRKFEEEGAPAHVVNEFETLLQWHIATYMDNDLPGQPQALQKSGRPVKSIRARLKGKEGRLRGNLMGKRVDFSARTVITGDPNIALDEVGVPFSIARNLTYPERVTPYNIAYLQQLVKNGPNEYPGARYVVRDSGDRIDLRYNKRETLLDFGWIVERHLKDGDLVLFNRQPSLHKMSMMAHRVKLMPYSTFRLNLSVTSPYNADFDGDEMNLHVPQSEETRAELMHICAVPRQIISPQANKPVMGIVQDTLCGVRKFTLRDCFMDREFIQNILMWVPEWDGVVPPPAIMKPKQLWTGKQIFSMCIPKGINLYRAPEPASPNPLADNGMWIEDGELMYGIVDKKTVGASQGGVIHVIFREKGPDVTRDFFSGCQKVVNFWLLHNGFSIGIGDTVPDKHTMATITNFIETAKSEVAQIILDAQEDKLEPEPGMSIRESFESKVSRALNTARDSSGRSAEKSLKEDNNVKQMVVAGSKGSFINISQMSACVGQQMVEGKRVPFGFKFRTLPHFTKDDYSPEARGFVENSYLRGLTPQEFFFHAMAGREGLIDTAVKTAETGYIQRRLVKALEDVMVAYDGTVRNSLGDVVQFIYGEDGMDGAFIEEQVVDPIRLSDASFERRYKVDVMDPDWDFKQGVLQVGLAEADIELQAVLDNEYRQLQADRTLLRTFIFPNGDPTVFLPVNIRRTIQNAQQIFHIDFRKPSDLPPQEILDAIAALIDRLVVCRGPADDRLTNEAQFNATLLFRIFLRSNFAVRRVIEEHHLNRQAFDWVLGEVEAQFNAAVAAPGEMCGTLAAQSIGEPATQMTLNTFHYAGVSSKSVTLGVPRLKEIINVAVNLKTPSMTVYLEDHISRDIALAKEVEALLSYTTLKTVTASTEIFYDPDPAATVIEDDREFVEAFFAIPDEDVEQNLHRQSPWLLRFELDRAKMLDKKLEMAFVAGKIAEVFEQDLFVIWSEDNAEKLIIRCRALDEHDHDKEEGESEEEDIFLKQLETSMLSTISLRGVEGVERVFMLKHKKNVITESGEFDNPVEWVLETDGINLRKVLCVEGVDSTRTTSNSCVEIMEVLGIEAARASLLRELRNVIEFDGSRVNYRHLSMLCDIMTNRGSLMAITRHGINRADTGALMRCSFEETVEILMDAAAIGEVDYCTGVAENVLLGQVAPMGTGAFEVFLDLKMLNEVVADHRYPVHNVLAADGSRTPGGAATPYSQFSDGRTPYNEALAAASFSPIVQPGGDGDYGGGMTPLFGGASPMYGGASPGYAPSSPNAYGASPGYNPRSPGGMTTSSPWVNRMGGATSPTYSPTSPIINFSPSSPSFSPASPSFSPSSPSFSPSSPSFSPSSPSFSPSSPSFSPSSPSFSPTSPSFSPSSPRYSPSSPSFSPSSPSFSPSSPSYSPTSPKYSPTSPQYSPQSGSPAYSPTSPAAARGGATSPGYNPAAGFSPASPAQGGAKSPSHYSSTSSWKR